jgi:hypothetical protein
MVRFSHAAQALTPGLITFCGSQALPAQSQSEPQTAAGILAQVREATGGDAKPEVFNRARLLLDPVNGVDNVMTVLAGSPGEASGLKPGDSITAINGQTPSDDPNDPIFSQPIGTVLHLAVRRDGAPCTSMMSRSRTYSNRGQPDRRAVRFKYKVGPMVISRYLYR